MNVKMFVYLNFYMDTYGCLPGRHRIFAKLTEMENIHVWGNNHRSLNRNETVHAFTDAATFNPTKQ